MLYFIVFSVFSRNDSEFFIKNLLHTLFWFAFCIRKIDLVFDIPTSHIIPYKIKKKLCSRNDSEFLIISRYFGSVCRRDRTICGGPDLVFRTRRVRINNNIFLNYSRKSSERKPPRLPDYKLQHPEIGGLYCSTLGASLEFPQAKGSKWLQIVRDVTNH